MLLCEKKVVDAKSLYQTRGWDTTITTINNITTVYVCKGDVCIKLGSYQAFSFDGGNA